MIKRAVLFSGQGAQAVGMGRDLVDANPEIRSLFDRANDAIGYDLASICFEGPEEELTKSSNTQPAIFVVSVACYELLRKSKPDLVVDYAAGLSSGEWTALHIAGVLSYEDTLKVLEARGRFMQQACEAYPGAMLSVIGLSEDVLAPICEATGITMANLNSPAQTVLSGSREGVEQAAPLAKEAGAKLAVPLKVAGAFHSPLMQSAADELAAVLEGIPFSEPSLPVVSNVTGKPHGGAETIRSIMVQQVTSSVLWYQGIDWMKEQGVSEYVECGPGKVLTGLVKRIDKQARLHNIHDQSSLERALEEL